MWEQASCLCSAYSLQPKTEKERAKQQPQVWPVCRMPGLLSGWQPPTHQGYTAVIRWEEMLEIPNSTDSAHVTWNEEGKSLPQFAYVMLGLASWLKSQNILDRSGEAAGRIHRSEISMLFFKRSQNRYTCSYKYLVSGGLSMEKLIWRSVNVNCCLLLPGGSEPNLENIISLSSLWPSVSHNPLMVGEMPNEALMQL